MKTPVKFGLRIWIAITSILSFLFGWMMFSHAGKPVQLFVTQPAIVQPAQDFQTQNLASVPSLDDLTGGGSSYLQPLPAIPQTVSPGTFPRFRTRGS